MIEVSQEKQRLLQVYANEYCSIDPSNCDKKPCNCNVMARYRAFLNLTIPRGYRNLTIKNFTGFIGREQCLTSKVAVNAKGKIVWFCWGNISLNDLNSMSESELDQSSIMGRRIKQGANIVIHGDSKRYMQNEDESERKTLVTKPMGRTLVASLITKEALKLKIEREHRMRHFDWVGFSDLVECLKQKNYDSLQSYESLHYEDCDWLVIDNITDHILNTTESARSYISQMLDAFFSHRLKQGRCTTLVFHFDVYKRLDEIEAVFGISIRKIIEDDYTHTILLTDKE